MYKIVSKYYIAGKANVSVKSPKFHPDGSAEGRWDIQVNGPESAMHGVMDAISAKAGMASIQNWNLVICKSYDLQDLL